MKIIKTLNIFVFTVTVMLTTLVFVSCGADIKNTNTVSIYTPRQIADAIIAAQADIPALQPLNTKDDYFEHYCSDIYRLNAEAIKDGIIYYADDGSLADEIAVFLLDENSGVSETRDALLKYIERRIKVFAGYSPEQTAILEKAVVIVNGNYAALIICKDPSGAKALFMACFGDNPPELPPESSEKAETSETTEKEFSDNSNAETNDIYDHDAILAAWNSGDAFGLSYKNRRIFDACAGVISAVITDDMSDFDKELAVHDRILEWADYDWEANNNAPDASPDPDNDNPYGLLINKRAICMGYTVTFKLFMDMLDIECIIVEGIARHNSGEHAWNMVRIDGDWYCVDVTWNDTSGEGNEHRYYNVSSDFMRETGHIWDESATPAATVR